MTRHAMVDIETWGTRVGSVIVGVGAAVFDPAGTTVEEPTYRANVKAADAMKEGLTVDADTIYWWLEQSPEARKAMLYPHPLTLRRVLDDLTNWYRSFREPKVDAVWSHGVTFDLMLLGAAYERVGAKPPWHYRDMRDTRTLFEIAGPYGYWDTFDENKPPEVQHDPLADAVQQAGWVQRAYRLIGANRGPNA